MVATVEFCDMLDFAFGVHITLVHFVLWIMSIYTGTCYFNVLVHPP
jgi:hypothetical protein